MTSPSHSSRSSFHWQSDFTDERKDQIVDWLKKFYKNNTPEDISILEDLIQDVREDERGFAAEQEAGDDF